MTEELVGIEKFIGNTPLVELKNIARCFNIKSRIFAKLESFNPGGSAKDRPALAMIRDAEASGRLKRGGVIIEPTSGNTGIGLALIAAARGYEAIIIMPDTMSIERRKIMKAYGAKLVLTDGKLGMKGAIAKAEELHRRMPNSIIAGQFENPANARAHYETTGPEIAAAIDGKIDFFVSAVGTGGTITGTGRYLKEQYPDIKVIAVEPETSAVLSGEKAGPHKIQGIGAGFIPKVLDTNVYDMVVPIKDGVAYSACNYLGACEGIFAGISSGAALAAATGLAASLDEPKTIVVIFPDTGERYLSTEGLWEGDPTPEEEIDELSETAEVQSGAEEAREETVSENPPEENGDEPPQEKPHRPSFQTNTTEGMDLSIIVDTDIPKPLAVATDGERGVVISLDPGGLFTFKMSLFPEGPRFFSKFKKVPSIEPEREEEIRQLPDEEIGVHLPIYGQVEPYIFLCPNPPEEEEENGENQEKSDKDTPSTLIGEIFWEKDAIAQFYQISRDDINDEILEEAKDLALSTIWRYNKVLTHQIIVINVCRKDEKDEWKKIGFSDSIYSTLWTSDKGDSDVRNYLVGIFDRYWGLRLYKKIALIHKEDIEEIEHIKRVNAYWK